MRSKTCRVAIALIPGANGKYLMGKRLDSGKFTFPAGHIEEKESPLEGLIREVKEETGLEVESARQVFVKINDQGKECFGYLVKAKGVVDTSCDPDKECNSWNFINPMKAGPLHIPLGDNFAIQWIARKNE